MPLERRDPTARVPPAKGRQGCHDNSVLRKNLVRPPDSAGKLPPSKPSIESAAAADPADRRRGAFCIYGGDRGVRAIWGGWCSGSAGEVLTVLGDWRSAPGWRWRAENLLPPETADPVPASGRCGPAGRRTRCDSRWSCWRGASPGARPLRSSSRRPSSGGTAKPSASSGPGAPAPGVLALTILRASVLACPSALSGYIDRGAGDTHHTEMWRHRSWRVQPWCSTLRPRLLGEAGRPRSGD